MQGPMQLQRHAGLVGDVIEWRAIAGFVGGVLFVDGSVLAQKWTVPAIGFVNALDRIQQRRH